MEFFIGGSFAIHMANGKFREPRDIDVFYYDNKPTDSDVYEFFDSEFDLDELGIGIEYHKLPKHVYDVIPTKHGLITLPGLYNLKISHSFFDVKWDKTMNDILFFQKIMPEYAIFDKDVFDVLYEHWLVVHGNKDYINLDRTKYDFFDDYVTKKIDHDILHKIIAHEPGVPVYTKCLKEGKEVLVDKNKFDCLTKDEKLNMIREEVYVIAIERYLNDYENYLTIYKKAFKKTIIDLSKGWFPLFAVLNYKDLYKPTTNYERVYNEGKNLYV